MTNTALPPADSPTPPPADPSGAAASATPPAPAPDPGQGAGGANPFDDPALTGGDTPPAPQGGEAPAAGEGAEGGTGEAKQPSNDGEKPAGAPEAYEDFTLPEGVSLEPTLLEEFKGAAKELNLPQEAAQRVVDIAAKIPGLFEQAQAQQVASIQQGWLDQAKADPEIGGANLKGALADAKRGLDALASPGLSEVLSAFGLAKHPEVIRGFAKLGKLVAEDKFVGGGDPASEKPDAANKLYPTMK